MQGTSFWIMKNLNCRTDRGVSRQQEALVISGRGNEGRARDEIFSFDESWSHLKTTGRRFPLPPAGLHRPPTIVRLAVWMAEGDPRALCVWWDETRSRTVAKQLKSSASLRGERWRVTDALTAARSHQKRRRRSHESLWSSQCRTTHKQQNRFDIRDKTQRRDEMDNNIP